MFDALKKLFHSNRYQHESYEDFLKRWNNQDVCQEAAEELKYDIPDLEGYYTPTYDYDEWTGKKGN